MTEVNEIRDYFWIGCYNEKGQHTDKSLMFAVSYIRKKPLFLVCILLFPRVFLNNHKQYSYNVSNDNETLYLTLTLTLFFWLK